MACRGDSSFKSLISLISDKSIRFLSEAHNFAEKLATSEIESLEIEFWYVSEEPFHFP